MGALEYFLARHPLDDVELTVTGLLDPIQRDRQIQSSIPSVVVAPLKVTRQSLLGKLDRTQTEPWDPAYRYASASS